MKWSLCVFTVAIWVFFGNAAAGADALSDIRERLGSNAVVCADFTQSKSLKALTRPLISKGNLIFVVRKGVLWQVREPFAAQVLVKSDALIKWDDKGVPQRVNFGQTPIFKALSEVFLAVFAGDLGLLQKSFDVQSNLSQQKWRLTMVPKDQAFAAIIKTVSVAGGQYVDELVITEGRGDQTEIQFTNMITEFCQLSDTEKRYFAH